MPLEKFFSGENINIKDLTIENPEKEEELWFDPEKEMTEEDWKEIREFLNMSFTNKKEEAKTPYAAMLMQVYPEKAEQFGADAVAKTLNERGEKILKEIERGEHRPTLLSSVLDEEDLLYCIKVLAPELFQRVTTPDRMERCTELVLKNSRGIASLSSPYVFRDVFMARTFMPQEKVKVESTREELDRYRENGWWEIFMTRAAAARLFSPETFAELGINEEAQKNMKEEFRKNREETLREKSHRVIPPREQTLLEEAVALKILAAEKIKFLEDGGIEIIMPKPKPELEPETPPMPERRTF